MTDAASDAARDAIVGGRTALGIELGSTRIKACLVGEDPSVVLAAGSAEWENDLVDGVWTYSIAAVESGVAAAYGDLLANVFAEFDVTPSSFAAIGVSAMMHGYLAFDSQDRLLVPFRTWRNTSTGLAAAELTDLFGVNIPLRWSIAHLHQAALDSEPHVPEIRFVTTLAGYVHWRLTGQRVLGVGDASGMFPIDPATGSYDATLLDRYDELRGWTDGSLEALLPRVLGAGASAGELTESGARLLDSSGALEPGIRLCPPEGDAGTGMVATNAIAPRTGNVSAGTSIFAMVVLERPLRELHPEVDVVTTPTGSPVAMVHCNNGASELGAWARMFGRFAELAGLSLDSDAVYELLLREALAGEPDGGGLYAYNQLAAEPVAGLADGRPLFVRMPDSALTLAGAMRAQLYGVFASLALGMRVLEGEGVAVDRMFAHGGIFRTAGVAQGVLAAALNATVSTAPNAAEGGAWGMAVLAAFAASESGLELDAYLRARVFVGTETVAVTPTVADVAAFARYLERYSNGLAVVRAAIDAL